jgi:hypothetical protein
VTLNNFSVNPAASLRDTTIAYMGTQGGVLTYAHGTSQPELVKPDIFARECAVTGLGHLYGAGPFINGSWISSPERSFRSVQTSNPGALFGPQPSSAHRRVIQNHAVIGLNSRAKSQSLRIAS